VLLGDAVAKNARSAVLRLDVADNAIDDKGLQALAAALQSLAHGVVHVDVSSNGAGARGTAALARALKLNAHNATTLVHLNLSNNAFDKDGSTALAAWLAQPNPLRVLLLAHTQLSIDIVVNAILRGCTSLEQLDLAGNRVRKEDSGALPKLLQSTPALHTLDLSRTQLPLDALDALLKAARQNPYLSQNFKLLLQDNALGTRGAQLLAQLAPQNLTVTSLDLADNEFGDEGIAILATALSNNTYVKHLNIDGGFRQAAKHTTEQRRNAVDCLKTLIASSCPLESLSMRGRTANGRGCALGDDLTDLLYELGSNESLLSLDVSGHDSRDGGAAALAKALLSNEKLRAVAIDENGTTIAGFESVRAAMRTNFSLLSFAVPLSDYAACAKTLPPAELDHVRHALAEINRLVARNHAPAARYEHATGGAAGTGAGGGGGGGASGAGGGGGGGSGGGGDDGFTAAQAEVERRAQKMRSVTATLSDEQAALLSDADQVSKDLWSALARTRDQHVQACAGELREQLAKCVADLLLPTLARHKREMVDSVMRVAQSHVGTMQDEDSRRLQMSVDFGARDVSADDVARVVTERCTAELGGKVRACFASAVDIALEGVCEKLIDRITEAEADNLARSSLRLKGAATITAELEEDNREPQTPRELNYQTLRRRPQSAIHDDADADAQVDEDALEEVDLGAPEGVPTHAVEMIDLNDDELDAIMPDLPVPEPPDEPAADGDDDDDADDAAAPDDAVAGGDDDERAPPPPPVDSDNEDDAAAPVAPDESPAPAVVPKPKALSPEVAATKAVPSLPAKVASTAPSAAAKSPPPSASPKPAAPAAATKPAPAQPLPKAKSGGGGLFGLLRKKDAPAGKAEAGKAAPKAKPAAAAAAAPKKVVAAVDVANLPKVQSNLQHVTKDRAAFAPKKRRPPTRRPRKDDQV
jgi:Ran GTPase-activating protein (RanGAP) involved in mRNA processing and transport